MDRTDLIERQLDTTLTEIELLNRRMNRKIEEGNFSLLRYYRRIKRLYMNLGRELLVQYTLLCPDIEKHEQISNRLLSLNYEIN